MKNTITAGLLGVILLTGCAYNPAIDTAGRSGTFDQARAQEITNDLQHCNQLARQNTIRVIDEVQQLSNLYLSTVTLGIIPSREKTYNRRVRQCLQGRGHSVID